MRNLALVLCTLFGVLLGFVVRPHLWPESGLASQPNPPAESGTTRTRSLATGTTHIDRPDPDDFDGPNGPETEAELEAELRAEYGKWRIRRRPRSAPMPPPEQKPVLPATAEGLEAMLLAGDWPKGVKSRDLARQLLDLRKGTGISLDLIRGLMQNRRGGEAQYLLRGLSGPDLLTVMHLALDGHRDEAERFRSLARWAMYSLPYRKDITVTDALINRLLAHDDTRLQLAGVYACRAPRTLRTAHLLNFLKQDASSHVKAYAIDSVARLVRDGRLPPAQAAPVIFAAVRTPYIDLHEAAIMAFADLGPIAAKQALELLTDPGFRSVARRDMVQSLLVPVVAAGKLDALPAAAWNATLAGDACAALRDGVRGDPELYKRASRQFPVILTHLSRIDEGVSEDLFSMATDFEDLPFLKRCIEDRALFWNHRFTAIQALCWNDETEAAGRRAAAERIVDTTDSVPLRIYLIQEIDAPEDDKGYTSWMTMMQGVASSEPNLWVRLIAMEWVRDYEE